MEKLPGLPQQPELPFGAGLAVPQAELAVEMGTTPWTSIIGTWGRPTPDGYDDMQ